MRLLIRLECHWFNEKASSRADVTEERVDEVVEARIASIVVSVAGYGKTFPSRFHSIKQSWRHNLNRPFPSCVWKSSPDMISAAVNEMCCWINVFSSYWDDLVDSAASNNRRQKRDVNREELRVWGLVRSIQCFNWIWMRKNDWTWRKWFLYRQKVVCERF